MSMATTPVQRTRRLARRRRRDIAGGLLTCGVAATLIWLAWDNGAYGATARYAVTITIWWVLGLGALLGLFPRTRLGTSALVALGLAAAYCLWTLASLLWASSAERVMVEFNRDAMYLGVLALVLSAVRARELPQLADGLALGIAVVAVIALASRLYPGPFPTRGVSEFLPGAVSRLSFPLGYWNGLAIFVALGIPLLLRGALEWHPPVARAAAVAVVPAVGSVIYLCSSRGGVAAAIVASTAFLVLGRKRWAFVGASAPGAAGTAVAVYVLHQRPELVNGPLGSAAAHDQRRSAAVLLILVCVATGVAFILATRAFRGRVTISRRAGTVAAVLVAVLVIVGLSASHPVTRFEAFKEPPGSESVRADNFVNAHLMSGSGSGRWQNWSVALDAWRSAPLRGIGAGGYESYWAQHRPIDLFVKDAHSLYLEALGELGVVGFLLLMSWFVLLVVSSARTCFRSADGERSSRAALLASGFGFLLAAGVDWMWELTVVGIVGLVALGAGLTTSVAPARAGALARFGATAVAALLVCSAGVSLLVELNLAESRSAAGAGRVATALSRASAAAHLAPWTASPRLETALLREQLHELPAARAEIVSAVRRDPQDWRLWLVRARIETQLGLVQAAASSLHRAAELNPRSPLFVRLATSRG